jgi:ABC-type phosphate transport system substrate-binding protein
MKKFLATILLWIALMRNCNPTDIIIWKETSNSIVLDKFTIQKIFTKQVTKWPNGQYIQVYTKPLYSIEHKAFLNNVLGLNPYYYQQLITTNSNNNPKAPPIMEVHDDNQMYVKVEQNPNSIGYTNYAVIIGSKNVIILDSDKLP